MKTKVAIIKNLNEDELNMLSESIDNILKLIPKIT